MTNESLEPAAETPSNTTEYNIFDRFQDAADEGEHMDDAACWLRVTMQLNRELSALQSIQSRDVGEIGRLEAENERLRELIKDGQNYEH